MPRSYDRTAADVRPVSIEPGFVRTATGSCLYEQGETRVICTATASPKVPRWLEGSGRGWVTAEYAMLPASTGERKERDSKRGRPDGRSTEIQRLIGRSLRGVVDLAQARRALDLRRLRRPPGRRRHPLRFDHRRLRRPAARDPQAARRGRDRVRSADRDSSRRSRSASSTASCSATSTTPRTRGPRSTRTSS